MIRGKTAEETARRYYLTRMWVIYENPSDFEPHDTYASVFVVREHQVDASGQQFVAREPTAVVNTLDEARKALPHEASCHLGRFPEDDPVIVEVWI